VLELLYIFSLFLYLVLLLVVGERRLREFNGGLGVLFCLVWELGNWDGAGAGECGLRIGSGS
jgi:hypothetical protein